MRYLLDTNILIAVMRHGDRRVMARMANHHGQIALSAIVLHELYYGAYESKRLSKSLANIEEIAMPVLEFDAIDAGRAGELRAELRRAGTPIGVLDTLIAGQALARNLILVTGNHREFARVKGLQVEDWLG